MAVSTYKTTLMIKVGMEYEKLIDIKDYPDLSGKPDQIETTTLSDRAQTFIEGIESQQQLEFTCNFDAKKYDAIFDYKNMRRELAIYFGGSDKTGQFIPDGRDGIFKFDGYVSCYPKGAGVNAVREMGLVITLASPITFEIPEIVEVEIPQREPVVEEETVTEETTVNEE